MGNDMLHDVMRKSLTSPLTIGQFIHIAGSRKFSHAPRNNEVRLVADDLAMQICHHSLMRITFGLHM